MEREENMEESMEEREENRKESVKDGEVKLPEQNGNYKWYGRFNQGRQICPVAS